MWFNDSKTVSKVLKRVRLFFCDCVIFLNYNKSILGFKKFKNSIASLTDFCYILKLIKKNVNLPNKGVLYEPHRTDYRFIY